MSIKIALAGNPNCGKTTLFNALTGSNQYVGNWPGVTVEKKEGKLKGHKDVTVVDLPGIYSLSPYTLEEVVSRNYLIDEKPQVILNIIDGTNLERNLYLTTQLTELGIPVLIAVNLLRKQAARQLRFQLLRARESLRRQMRLLNLQVQRKQLRNIHLTQKLSVHLRISRALHFSLWMSHRNAGLPSNFLKMMRKLQRN